VNKIKFSMAFHCYQPVFNFDGEFKYAYTRAYLPLLEMFEKHSGIRASFHYPGNMLKWFQENHPEYIKKLQKLVNAEQIEIIGGCYYEPVMSMIPDDDRKEQIEKNNSLIQKIFNIKPRGAWLTERVWEPELADTLINSDMEYTILDDNHLLKAGAEKKDLFRPWDIKEKSGKLVVFPAHKDLRYFMPFRSPESILDYMKKTLYESIGDKCLFFADDGEKFGVWPHTYKLVYEEGWLDRFFSLLTANSDLVETYTYSEIMDTVNSKRIRNLPTSSYSEMMAWSEGDFNNFFKKYPESNRMHKRMLCISEMIRKKNRLDVDKIEETRIKKAKTELYKAQSGCAYWHGVFGGVYLPHLRSGVYHHLIKAKDVISKDSMSLSDGVRSIEHKLGDGDTETVIENNVVDVFLRSSDGGGISEIDYKPRAVNLVNSMTRIKEQYHEKVKWRYLQRTIRARRAITQGVFADIHDALGVGEKGLKRFLYYDDYCRSSFITHIFDKNVTLDKLYTGLSGDKSFLKGVYDFTVEPDGGSIKGIFTKRDKIQVSSGKILDIGVEKRVVVGKNSVIDLTHKLQQYTIPEKGSAIKYAIEFNMLIWDGERIYKPCRIKTDRLFLKDKYSGLSVSFSFDSEQEVLTYPVYTVNETEKGLKKTFQGMAVVVGREFQAKETGLQDSIGIKIEII